MLLGILFLFSCRNEEQYYWEVDYELATAYVPDGKIFRDEFLAQGMFSPNIAFSELGFYYSENEINDSNIGQYIEATDTADLKFTAWIEGLKPGTNYYVQAVGKSGDKVYKGRNIRVTTTDDNILYVTVVNGDPNSTDIDARDVNVYGIVTDLGNDEAHGVVEYGAYYWPESMPDSIKRVSIETVNVQEIPVNEPFSVLLSDLEPNTAYNYKIFARNSRREAFVSGDDMIKSFTTMAVEMPQVKTGEIVKTASTDITVRGELTFNGYEPKTTYGFYYGTAEPLMNKFECNNVGEIEEGVNNLFEAKINKLEATTEYLIQAFASNSVGEARGEIIRTVTKEKSKPVIELYWGTIEDRLSNINESSVKVRASVSSNGGSKISKCGVIYGLSPDALNSTADGVMDESGDFFSVDITGLSSGQIVYYQIFAENELGRAEGATIESIATKIIERKWVNMGSDQGTDGPNTYMALSDETLEYYELPPVTVLEDDGNYYRYYFLDRNLGASKVAENSTNTKDMNSIGYIYQFGYSIPSSEPSTGYAAQANYGWVNDNNIISYDIETGPYGEYQKWKNDPSPIGYHIPTSKEWQFLIDSFTESEQNIEGAYSKLLIGLTMCRNNAGNGQNEKYAILLSSDSQISTTGTTSPRGAFYANEDGMLSFGGLNPIGGVVGNLPNNNGYVNVTQSGGAPIRCMRKMLVTNIE